MCPCFLERSAPCLQSDWDPRDDLQHREEKNKKSCRKLDVRLTKPPAPQNRNSPPDTTNSNRDNKPALRPPRPPSHRPPSRPQRPRPDERYPAELDVRLDFPRSAEPGRAAWGFWAGLWGECKFLLPLPSRFVFCFSGGCNWCVMGKADVSLLR